MKLVNGLLRFTQLILSIALIGGYIFNGLIWDLVVQYEINIGFETFVDIYLIMIGALVVSVPIRFIIEKVVESKFLL